MSNCAQKHQQSCGENRLWIGCSSKELSRKNWMQYKWVGACSLTSGGRDVSGGTFLCVKIICHTWFIWHSRVNIWSNSWFICSKGVNIWSNSRFICSKETKKDAHVSDLFGGWLGLPVTIGSPGLRIRVGILEAPAAQQTRAVTQPGSPACSHRASQLFV